MEVKLALAVFFNPELCQTEILQTETEKSICGSRMSVHWMMLMSVVLLSTNALSALCYHSISSCQSKPTCSFFALCAQALHLSTPKGTARKKHYVNMPLLGVLYILFCSNMINYLIIQMNDYKRSHRHVMRQKKLPLQCQLIITACNSLY